MADPGGLTEIGKTAVAAASGGGLVLLVSKFLGGLLQGWISGAGPQEKELRSDLATRVGVLEKRLDEVERRLTGMTRERDEWRHLALQARLEAEKLGYDRTGWPENPKETS